MMQVFCTDFPQTSEKPHPHGRQSEDGWRQILSCNTDTTPKTEAFWYNRGIPQPTNHHTTTNNPTMADPGNRERGLKAAINNPRVSEKAKQRDREILENEFGSSGGVESEREYEYEDKTPPVKTHAAATSKISKAKTAPAGLHDYPDIGTAKQTAGMHQMTSDSVSSMPAEPMAATRETRSTTSAMAAGTPTSAGMAEGYEGKGQGNVIRGLKSAISNPHVSEKAKDKDRKKLRDLGEMASE
ncbi:hypothetical protein B0T17DRAFT_625201 [Bombardia bombarda]|uniref:Uncharacterized protein n=1 Tax=Bombardia bombarda TaxID=252184 RepID=A0AA39XL88_9PEZI|nr:hypothetical protein B0T17DRAFT_625201 [Bombardia bombarda]